MQENIQYKKKIIDPQPNRLFIAWLKELKSDAKQNGNKAFFSYKKALKSLEKFPLPLSSGKECSVLEGFGDKLCSIIDSKLNNLAESQGLSCKKALKKANSELAGKIKKSKLKSVEFKLCDQSFCLLYSLNELRLNNPKNENGFTKFEIIPVGMRWYLNYEIYEKNTERDNEIWKEIKKLIKERYVEQNSKRYKLTKSGIEFYVENEEYKKQSKNNNPKESTETPHFTELNLFDSENEEENNEAKCVLLPTDDGKLSEEDNDNEKCIDSELDFYFVGSLNSKEFSLVYRKFSAAFIEESEGNRFYRVKIHEDSISPIWDYRYDFDNLDTIDGYKIIFLSNNHLPEHGRYVKESLKPKLSSKSFDIQSKNIVSNHIGSNNTAQEILNSHPIVTNRKRKSLDDVVGSGKVLKPASEASVKSKHSKELDSHWSIDYKMSVDTFQVILIVDNRESFGCGQLKKILCSSLDKAHIHYETRAVPVGDFLWIARDKNGREAVLDIIVERKKYDDLAKSIMDGRFKDQKLRMKNRGFSKIIYLLEKHKGMQNLSLPIESLNQAIINSQSHENTSTVITEGGQDTIKYICNLTKKLIEFYQSRSLEVYSSQLPETSICIGLSSRAIDFVGFSSAAQKTQPLTISEMFAKHLICIHGISPEKCMSIIQKYPTPRLLMEAYINCSTDQDRIDLLSTLKLESSSKSFGMANSKSVLFAYTRK